MAEAERRTKLWNGAGRVVSGLSGACGLSETQPTPVGRRIAFDYLMRRLMTRLQVIDRAKSKPDPQLSRGTHCCMGLPRTGTTFLHRLLALDPDNRCPETHELLDPLSRRPLHKRVKYWDSKLNLMKRLVPHLEQIHDLGAREAEECLLALSVDVPLLPPTFRHLVRHCVSSGTFLLQGALPNASSSSSPPRRQRWALKCRLISLRF